MMEKLGIGRVIFEERGFSTASPLGTQSESRNYQYYVMEFKIKVA
jgi:hypothetical protein